MQLKGKLVKICTNHKIYGEQRYKAHIFHPFCTDDKVGFISGTNKIFLYFNEIENIEVSKNTFIINGILQKITIKII